MNAKLLEKIEQLTLYILQAFNELAKILQQFVPLIYTQYNSNGHFRFFKGRLNIKN
jgi:hypothetical protein